MPEKPTALVVRTAGTNCDRELARAFEAAGARAEMVHVDRLCAEPALLESAGLVGFPGGFSYGDDIASGRVLAVKMRTRLYPALRDAVERGVPMIGVCNGFQVLAQMALLPGPDENEPWPDAAPEATVALADNDPARFVDRWVAVEPDGASPCVWTRDLWPGGDGRDAVMRLPVANGEGRFIAAGETIEALRSGAQIALRYNEPVNGSMDNVAGVCDRSGMVFGLMPHPERYAGWTRHPFWTRLAPQTLERETPGLRMFRNAVEHAKSPTAA